MEAFAGAAHRGLQVGARETGAAVPPQLQAAAHLVFAHAFVDATRISMLLPIAAIVVTAGACLAVRVQPPAGTRPSESTYQAREPAA